MSFESHEGPPVAAFPLPALAATDLDDADMRPPNVAAPAGFRGCHYIMAAGRELWHKAYRCSFGLSSRHAEQCSICDVGALSCMITGKRVSAPAGRDCMRGMPRLGMDTAVLVSCA